MELKERLRETAEKMMEYDVKMIIWNLSFYSQLLCFGEKECIATLRENWRGADEWYY